jgi:hypothetical protein
MSKPPEKKKKENPRVLPEVKYQPVQPRSLGGDMQNAWDSVAGTVNAGISGFNQTQNALGDALGPAADYLTGNVSKTAYPTDYQPKVGRPMGPVGQTPPGWSPNMMSAGGTDAQGNPLQGLQDWWAGLLGGGQPSPAGASPDPVGKTPAGWTPGAVPENNPMGAGLNNPNEPGPMPNQYNRLQDAVQKNQSLTDKAQAAGDEKEMKRLDDEWARLTSTPQFKAMYGNSDPMALKERLINSYMQSGNDAAEASMDRAGGRMIADDVWAQAFQATTGGPPSQIHWDEHWSAMNKGGRDPLEGHPMAVQAIQAKMKEMEQANQQASYDSLQKWFTNSNPL